MTISWCCSSEWEMLRASNGIWSSIAFSRMRFSATNGTSGLSNFSDTAPNDRAPPIPATKCALLA